MKKPLLLTMLLMLAMIRTGWSQTVEFDFPRMSGDTAWVYLFTGSRVDSVNVVLDGNGKARLEAERLKSLQDYCGIAYIYIPGKGAGEFVIAEPQVRIACLEEKFNSMNLEFPQSAENLFLRQGFMWRNYLMNQAPPSFPQEENASYTDFADKQVFTDLYEMTAERNKKASELLDSVIAKSPLFAARFLESMLFMQRLYTSIQTSNTSQQHELKNEIEYTLDINALFHTGNLWTEIQNWYPGLFIGPDGKPIEEDYAASVGVVLSRLEVPVLTAFLSDALVACERMNLSKAQEAILSDFVKTYPLVPVTDPKAQRIMNALNINKGTKAPVIEGLEKPLSQPAIIIFFESDCGHCQNEINWLADHYMEITKRGYRIISIASDMIKDNYQNIAGTLPWDKADRLCDFKGTGGENFRNYGVVGTPTIFVVDKNGEITGKYAQMKEIDDLIN